MTRHLALIALIALTLLACGDDRRSSDEPVPDCEVGQGHLCGESAPGVECPVNMVCVNVSGLATGGLHYCQMRCNPANAGLCVPDFCEQGAPCWEAHSCKATATAPGAVSDLCYSPLYYSCVGPDGTCPSGYEERDGWCAEFGEAWSGTPFD